MFSDTLLLEIAVTLLDCRSTRSSSWLGTCEAKSEGIDALMKLCGMR